MIIGFIQKQPGETLDYDIDCTPAFNDDSTDFVSEVSVNMLGDGNLSVTPVIASPNSVKLWVTGGTDNERYVIEVTVTTDAGRVKEDEIEVLVQEFE